MGYQAVFQSAEKNLNSAVEVNYFINDNRIVKKSLRAGMENEFQTLRSPCAWNSMTADSGLRPETPVII